MKSLRKCVIIFIELALVVLFLLILGLIIYIATASVDCMIIRSLTLELCYEGILPQHITTILVDILYVLQSLSLSITVAFCIIFYTEKVHFVGFLIHFKTILRPPKVIYELWMWLIIFPLMCYTWITGDILSMWWLSITMTLNIFIINLSVSILAPLDITYMIYSQKSIFIMFKMRIPFLLGMFSTLLFNTYYLLNDSIIIIMNLIDRNPTATPVERNILILIQSIIIYYRTFVSGFCFKKLIFPSHNILIDPFENNTKTHFEPLNA